MYLSYFVAWFPIIIFAFANAAIREAVYKRYVSELASGPSDLDLILRHSSRDLRLGTEQALKASIFRSSSWGRSYVVGYDNHIRDRSRALCLG